jgi:hypothetical protein
MSKEVTVAGRQVTLRTSFRGKEFGKLPGLLPAAVRAIGPGEDIFDIVPVLCLVIEAWNWDIPVDDPASYEELEVLTELRQLALAVMDHLGEHILPNPP